MQHASEHTPNLTKSTNAAACFQFGKIVVSDTSGTIDTSASYYPPQATYTRDSAGQYTVTLPAMSNATAYASVLCSATVDSKIHIESIATSDATTTIVFQVCAVGTPAAADLETAADAIHFQVFGTLNA